jgi:hypothetical protein
LQRKKPGPKPKRKPEDMEEFSNKIELLAEMAKRNQQHVQMLGEVEQPPGIDVNSFSDAIFHDDNTEYRINDESEMSGDNQNNPY